MTRTASGLMTAPAITIGPQARVAEIAGLLSRNRISAAPVCDAQGALLGMVSEGDLMRPFRESARLRRDWWLGLLADGEGLSQDFLDYIRVDARTAADVMTAPAITADETATLPELAELMIRHGVKRVPIMRAGRIAGVVSRADLVRAIAAAPAGSG